MCLKLISTLICKRLKSIHNLTDCHQLQDDLDMLSLWSNCSYLSFNESKCAFISFHSKHPVINHSYQLDTQVIKGCEHHKDLGVLMSSDLSWSAHIRLISGRAYKILGLLLRTFSSANSPSTKKSLYISLVRSQLIYCSHFLLKYILYRGS